MSQTVGAVSTPIILLSFFAIFWTILFLLKLLAKERLERLGLDVNVPLVLWRTKRFNNILDAIARRARDPWKVIGTIGFAVSLGLIPIAVRVMLSGFLPYFATLIAKNGPEPLKSFVMIFFKSQINQPTAPVTLFLPGLTVKISSIFDFFIIIVALLVVIAFHEGAHGVLARAEGITVKNSGLLFLLAIPGAFVEPDEEQLSKAKRISQLRILSAGTSSNFAVGLVFLLLVANLGIFYATISPFYQPSAGVLVLDVTQNSGASNARISVGQVITQISNATVRYPIQDVISFQAALNKTRPGQIVVLELLNTTSGQLEAVNVTLSVPPKDVNTANLAFLGVSTFNYYPAKFPSVLNSFIALTVYQLYNRIFLFSIGIAVVNMLPIWGLDGDRVVKLLLQKFFGRHKTTAAYTLTAARVFSISIIAIAAITTFYLRGQIPF